MRYEVRNPTGELVGFAEFKPHELPREMYYGRHIRVAMLKPFDQMIGLNGYRGEMRVEVETVEMEKVNLQWRQAGFKNAVPTLILRAGSVDLLREQSWFKAS